MKKRHAPSRVPDLGIRSPIFFLSVIFFGVCGKSLRFRSQTTVEPSNKHTLRTELVNPAASADTTQLDTRRKEGHFQVIDGVASALTHVLNDLGVTLSVLLQLGLQPSSLLLQSLQLLQQSASLLLHRHGSFRGFYQVN